MRQFVWKKGNVSLSTEAGFYPGASADRANVVYRDLHGCVCRRASFLKSQGMCYWSSAKHSYLILLMVRRVRMVAETVLGRNFEPSSTRVERWSSLTRLPCAKQGHPTTVFCKYLFEEGNIT